MIIYSSGHVNVALDPAVADIGLAVSEGRD
jgi:hypothetical protein